MRHNPLMDPVFFTPDQDAKRPRRLFGGGGGGGDPSAYARQQDAERKAGIQSLRASMGYADLGGRPADMALVPGNRNRGTLGHRAPALIHAGNSGAQEKWDADNERNNSAKTLRDQNYQGVYDNVRGFHEGDLSRLEGEAQRQMKFSLARQGQLGGSLEVDSQGDFMREQMRGRQELDSVATQSKNRAVQADLDALGAAEGAINQGASAENALTTAMSRMAASQIDAFEQAKGAAVGTGLGSLAEGFMNRSRAQGQSSIVNALNRGRGGSDVSTSGSGQTAGK